jgi:hypothetical protein
LQAHLKAALATATPKFLKELAREDSAYHDTKICNIMTILK